jgi:hypothetical protein
MSSGRFGGHITIGQAGGRDPFQVELDSAIGQFREYGYSLSADVSGTGLMSGVAGAFAPEELGPVRAIPNAGTRTQQYFGNEVRPQLTRDAEAGNPKALALAHQFGRLIGAANQTGRMTPEKPLPFEVTTEEIVADGVRQPYDVETGLVIDYGMGISGVIMHLENVRNERYEVLGVQKTLGEQALLRGVAAQRNVAEARYKSSQAALVSTCKPC